MIKMRDLLNEADLKLYHVTSMNNANNIIQNGFDSGKIDNGISSESSNEFIYLGDKSVALYFYNNHSRGNNNIIECSINGEILNIPLKTSDFGAMASIYDHFNIEIDSNRTVDESFVKKLLFKNGYIGFSFKDKYANNKLVYAIGNKQKIKPTKIIK